MELSCYGQKFGRLDKCRICEYAEYCRSARDITAETDVSFDDVAYSEEFASTPATGYRAVPIEPDIPIYSLNQMNEVIRRLVDLEDNRIRDILRAKFENPDISYSQIGEKYGVSKQAIHQYINRAIKYCPELAPVIQNRPGYNSWRRSGNPHKKRRELFS